MSGFNYGNGSGTCHKALRYRQLLSLENVLIWSLLKATVHVREGYGYNSHSLNLILTLIIIQKPSHPFGFGFEEQEEIKNKHMEFGMFPYVDPLEPGENIGAYV